MAIGLVVLVVVAHEVEQREAVVCRHEVHAGGGTPAVHIEHVTGGTQPRREISGTGRALPEITHYIAEAVVPLGPSGREGTDLVAARPAIPWLCDQLHGAQHRILVAGL